MRTTTQWIGVMVAAAAVAVAAGCRRSSSDDPAPAGGATGLAPALTSVSPVSGDEAGGTAITLTGTNFEANAGVWIGGAAATSISVNSATEITAVTPAGTFGGADVTVRNPGGFADTLANGFSYTSGGAPPGPSLTAVQPGSGPLTGGAVVTLIGSGFQPGATVTFGGNAATSVSVRSAGSATCVTPPGTVGQVHVELTNPDTRTAMLTWGYTYMSFPTVTSVSPAAGDVSGGTPVIITGTNFHPNATCDFGGTTSVGINVLSPTSIACFSPSGAAGAVAVTVTNPNLQSGTLANAFTFTTGNTLPTASNVNPSSGTWAGGTTITITGANIDAAATVTVGGIPCTNVNWVDGNTIEADTPLAPPGATAVQTVTVVNPGGAAGANSSPGFTYLPGPVDTATTSCLNPDVAIDAAGNIYAVWEQFDGSNFKQIMQSRSTDGGRTWSTPQQMSGSANAHSTHPRIAAGGDGVATIVWDEPGVPSGYLVAYATRTGPSSGWVSSFFKSLPSSPIPPNADIAMDPAGNRTVAWNEQGGTIPLVGGNYVLAKCAAWPASGGIGATVDLAGASTIAGPPACGATSGGIALVAYETPISIGGPVPGGSSTHNVQLHRTTNGGSTWSQLASPGTGLNAGVALHARGNAVYLAWLGRSPAPQSGTNNFVWTRSSTDAGATWNAAVSALTTGAVKNRPAVGAGGDGTVQVAWESGGEIWVARSSDLGATWATAVNLSNNTGTSQQPQLAGDGGSLLVTLWADDTAATSVYDILSRR